MSIVGPINPWLVAFAAVTTICAISWALCDRHQRRQPAQPDLIDEIERWLQETPR